MERMCGFDVRKIVEMTISILLVIGVIVFVIDGCRNGIFQSKEAMEAYMKGYGLWAPLVLILIQTLQVIIPVLPGTVGLVLAPVMFGMFGGFLINYVAICMGSMGAFLLGRKYGKPFVRRITGEKFYNKYSNLLDSNHKFIKIFAALILFPFAPDDYLCYLAGLSSMKMKHFLPIIAVGKIPALLAYSFFLSGAYHYILRA